MFMKNSEKSRYSIIAVDPVHEFSTVGHSVTIDGQTTERTDPLMALQDLVVTEDECLDELPFQGGAIGYVGFDMIATYENKVRCNQKHTYICIVGNTVS